MDIFNGMEKFYPMPRAQRERRYRERPARAHRCVGRPSHGDGARAARGGGAHREFLILEFFAIKKKEAFQHIDGPPFNQYKKTSQNKNMRARGAGSDTRKSGSVSFIPAVSRNARREAAAP